MEGAYPGPPSRTSATKFALFCRICLSRGRRSRRHFFVAVADTGRPLFWNLSRSPKLATLFCRGRRYRPPFTLKSVAVAEVGGTFLSRSPIPAAPHSEICRGRRSRRHIFVAVADTGRPSFWNLSRSPKRATLFCRGRRVLRTATATKCRFLSRFAGFFFSLDGNELYSVWVRRNLQTKKSASSSSSLSSNKTRDIRGIDIHIQ